MPGRETKDAGVGSSLKFQSLRSSGPSAVRASTSTFRLTSASDSSWTTGRLVFIFDDFVYVLSGQAKARILEVNWVEGFHLV